MLPINSFKAIRELPLLTPWIAMASRISLMMLVTVDLPILNICARLTRSTVLEIDSFMYVHRILNVVHFASPRLHHGEANYFVPLSRTQSQHVHPLSKKGLQVAECQNHYNCLTKKKKKRDRAAMSRRPLR
ncbi:hypothetical protein CEXT_114261 [Caerostris extrusa]|uniref:Uncharacterized protein n=1 Tax=Caerostris extrusa TaxID=172846 RepID=A0AAV4PLH5_CAEEX|nr:hypothetical protein CEXT_114261 [Caerostris extrusa]